MSLVELKKQLSILDKRIFVGDNKQTFNIGEKEIYLKLKEDRNTLADKINYMENKEMMDRVAEIERKQKEAYDKSIENQEGIHYENEVRDSVKPSEIHDMLSGIFDKLSTIPSEHLALAVKSDELKDEWDKLVKDAKIVFKHIPKTNSYRVAVLQLFNNTFKQNVTFEYVPLKEKEKEEAQLDETPDEKERRELIAKLTKK